MIEGNVVEHDKADIMLHVLNCKIVITIVKLRL